MTAASVLVVDDETLILDLAGRALGAAGYDVQRAATPGRALEIVQGGRPVDLVVTDVVMPDMLGPQLVTEIRRVSPSTRAMFISGYADVAQLPAEIPFLRKPFSPRELVAAVERALAECTAVRQEVRRAVAEARELKEERQHMAEEMRRTAERAKGIIAEAQSRLERKKPPR